MKRYLAQANVAQFRHPISDNRMMEMRERIEEMNQLAEESDGFVWPFGDGGTDEFETSIFERYLRPFDQERLFFNMSVWKDVDSLKNYVYRSAHSRMLNDSHLWMEEIPIPSLVLWWVEEDEVPTVSDALQRFVNLKRFGSSSRAFNFRKIVEYPTD